MQGHLRKEFTSIDVTTECEHCDQVLNLKVDSNMEVSVGESDANPLVFVPEVDWDSFGERNIIDAY